MQPRFRTPQVQIVADAAFQRQSWIARLVMVYFPWVTIEYGCLPVMLVDPPDRPFEIAVRKQSEISAAARGQIAIQDSDRADGNLEQARLFVLERESRRIRHVAI